MNIITDEHVLRGENSRVKLFEIKNIMKLVPSMMKIMEANNGCGLASPQVGVNKTFFIAKFGEKHRLFINPEIVLSSEEKGRDYEGCLSIPGINGIVERHLSISVKHFDVKTLKPKTELFSGLKARIIQHEIDHLNGILYTDIAEEIFCKDGMEQVG